MAEALPAAGGASTHMPAGDSLPHLVERRATQLICTHGIARQRHAEHAGAIGAVRAEAQGVACKLDASGNKALV